MDNLMQYFDENQLHPDELLIKDQNTSPNKSKKDIGKTNDLDRMPYHYKTRLRGGATTTIQAVMKEIQKVWAKRYAKDDERSIELQPSYATLDNYDGKTIILYRKLEVEPSPDFRNPVPVYRDRFANPDRMDQYIEIKAQVLDYYMVFDITGKNGQEVEDISEDFWDFLIRYADTFKKLGVKDIRFVRIQEEFTDRTRRVVLHNIPMVFKFSIEKVFSKNLSSIQGLTIEAQSGFDI